MPPSGLEHSDDLLTKLDHAIQRVLDVSGIRYDDPNHPSSPVVVVGWNNWQWTQLPDDAAPLVGAARDALRRVREFASNAARHAPDRAAELRRLETRLERLIDQPNGTLPCGAPESTIEAVRRRY